MKEHKHAEVLRAIADGKEVQFRNGNTGWKDAEFRPYTPLHHEGRDFEWRVKPEPKPDYCLYAGYNDSNDFGELFNYESGPMFGWKFKMKITIDGETNEPKFVEQVK